MSKWHRAFNNCTIANRSLWRIRSRLDAVVPPSYLGGPRPILNASRSVASLAPTCSTRHETPISTPATRSTRLYHEKQQSSPPLLPHIADLATPEVYTRLHKHASTGAKDQTRAIVEYLVRERHERPSAELYSALVLANISPEQGSAEHVSRLLREMEVEGISLDSSTCHHVLRVLSVHVDHLLRADIMAFMSQQWFTVTTEGRQYIAAALLREGDLELGLDAVKELQADGPEAAPAWLIELATDLLFETSQISSALDLIMSYKTNDKNSTLSPAVYMALLDQASLQHHLSGTVWAWNAQVATGQLDPGAGVCLNVLATAAHHGDSELATQAFQRLGSLAYGFTTREYELLYQSYLTSPLPDIDSALHTLAIMASNELYPNASCMRPLYKFLSRQGQSLQQALEVVVRMRHADRLVPLPILNTILEVHATRGDSERALEVYRTMPEFENYNTEGDERIPFASTKTFEHVYTAINKDRSKTVEETAQMACSVWEDQQAMGIPLSPSARALFVDIWQRSGRSDLVDQLPVKFRNIW